MLKPSLFTRLRSSTRISQAGRCEIYRPDIYCDERDTTELPSRVYVGRRASWEVTLATGKS